MDVERQLDELSEDCFRGRSTKTRPGVSSGSPLFCRPMRVGTEGPNTSRSSIPTRNRAELLGSFSPDKLNARFTMQPFSTSCAKPSQVCAPAIVLLPTPPLPLATATTLRTFGIVRLMIGPPRRGICGGAPRCGSPCKIVIICPDTF